MSFPESNLVFPHDMPAMKTIHYGFRHGVAP